MPSWPELRAAALAAALAAGARGETTFYQARIAPILDRHCVGCHGPEKQKARLRLDSFEAILRGAESGEVLKPGDVPGSELFRRITLPADDEELMPSDGKPRLSREEVRNLELWIAGGASPTKVVAEFPDAPALRQAPVASPPLAPDWQPHAAEIAALAQELGVRLIPRSRVPTDGLILRTASAPGRCEDSTLERLAPVAKFITEAELARTRVTDAGLASLAAWENLRMLDLTRTAVTSQGLAALRGLSHLATLNLTDTAVDEAGVTPLRALPELRQLWLFGTRVTAPAEGGASAAPP